MNTAEPNDQPPVAGRPPALWAWGAVHAQIGVLPSPAPRIAREGWQIAITGVRFVHTRHRGRCRHGVQTSTEGGRITLGFARDGRAFERYEAGGQPRFSGTCPHCGERLTTCGDPRPGSPVADAYRLVAEHWESLRRDLGVRTVDLTDADLLRLGSTPRRTRARKSARR